jgi:peptide/nickel transport system substrate-binding protein
MRRGGASGVQSAEHRTVQRALRTGLGSVALLTVVSCSPVSRGDTVVYASGADLESANPLVTVHPLSRQIQRYALFVTLTKPDSALEPRPYLARRWRWSSDRRALTLELYRGLRWHDGAVTTASDVAFTIEAARDPETGSPRASDLANIDSAVVENDTAVTIHFRNRPPAFPPILGELPIAPAHLLAKEPRAELRRAAFNFAPVGNGPFRFVRREAGRRWIFERVADFPVALGGPAHVHRLVIAVVDEPTTKFAGLVSADLDVAGIAPNMADLVARDPSLRVISYPVSFATALVLNCARPPFDDVRVRRAVDAIIDRKRIVDAALAGYGTPAVSATSESHPYHFSTTRPSSAAADSMLDSAGWRRNGRGERMREGRELRFTLLTVGSGDNAVEQLVQADMRTHGITMEIRQVELGAFLTAAREYPKRFDALITGIPGDLSLAHLTAMFSSGLAGGALDYAGYHTQALDALFTRVKEASDEEMLASAWRDVQSELGRDVPVSWLYHSRGVQGISRRLDGVRMDLRGELTTLADWRIGTATTRGAP